MGRIHWGSLLIGAAVVLVFQMFFLKKRTAA